MYETINELLGQHKLSDKTRDWFAEILLGGKNADKCIGKLTPQEKEQLKAVVNNWLKLCAERQATLVALNAKIGGETTNATTHYVNRNNIHAFIKGYLLQHHTMPSITAIAEGVQLSRKAVRKHLASSAQEQNEMFENCDIITKDIVGTIAIVAIGQNNIKAAKTYIDVVEKLKKNRTKPLQVQVNSYVITQQMLEELDPGQQARLVEVVKERHDIAQQAEEAEIVIEADEQTETEMLTEPKEQTALNTRVHVPTAVKAERRVAKEKLPKEQPTVKFEPVKIREGGETLFE